MDVRDGVVIVAHSLARNAGTPQTEPLDELMYTALPEGLIESVTVYEPVKTDKEAE
jgi:hypothetical protein